MALKTAARGAQYLLFAEFSANFNDTMKDINGATKTFGSVAADSGTFDVILLPVGALVDHGELAVETAVAGPTTQTIQIGTATTASAFLGPTTSMTAQRTAFTVLGPVPGVGENVRIAIATAGAAATNGKFRVRVAYTIDNKVNEVVTN